MNQFNSAIVSDDSLVSSRTASADVAHVIDAAMSLSSAMAASCRLQGKALDRLRLHFAISQYQDKLKSTNDSNWRDQLSEVALAAGAVSVDWMDALDPACLPAISWLSGIGWVVVRSELSTGEWLFEHQGKLFQHSSITHQPAGRLVFSNVKNQDKTVLSLFKQAFLSHKKTFIEGVVAGVLINLLALGSSLYSMQVYDRVIPTQGYSTLFVLTLGVGIAVFFELLFKLVRSYMLEHAVSDIDSRLSREIFSRLLCVRLDQLPGAVGSLSAQLRGYETIRAFFSAATFYVLLDVPFGLFFILLIAFVGGFWVALVPLAVLIFAIAIGITLRKQIDNYAQTASVVANLKTGLLVEAIEGAETIKAGGGAWGVLARWLDVSTESIQNERAIRSIAERTTLFSAVLQQLSYVILVGVGAFFAAEGELTMGALIACSILSQRALGPIAQVPMLMSQRAHAKAALLGLEKVFKLETDNHGVERPLVPERVTGEYTLERVRFAYAGSPEAISIPQLRIAAGDKVGIVGHIGSGKSTLLRLLAGLYLPSEGRILLDGLDIAQISASFLADQIGYLQQDHRLFSGTLRQNLLIGIPDPGDEMILAATKRTGLLDVIKNHPSGLDLLIAEGGKGLSGGQRQLVALTRLLLSNPHIWLLDEPTASMDELTEDRCIRALHQEIKPEHTMVLVTHKPVLLNMTNRLIVMANQQIVMDGPRESVFAHLKEIGRQQR